MQVFPKLLLVAALLVLAGNGTLRADGIVQSSEPFLLTGDGFHSWDHYDHSGGYELWATGTNGIDTLGFRISRYDQFGSEGVEFRTTSGEIPRSGIIGIEDGLLRINGITIHRFEFYLGNQNGYINLYDDDHNFLATIRALGYFHQTSFLLIPTRSSSDGPAAFATYGTFQILPYAPVPEPDMAAASALILACLGIYGFRRKSVSR